jgi:hypothetical protein
MLNHDLRNPGLDLIAEVCQEDQSLILEETIPVLVRVSGDFLILEAKREAILKEVDPKFIRHKIHYDRLFKGDENGEYPGGGGSSFDSVKVNDREVRLKVKGSYEWVSSGNPKKTYIQTFSFPHMKSIMRGKKKGWRDKALSLINGHIRVHCDCPAFRYYYNYVAGKKGFALYPEMRSADIRNPKKKGAVCKHLHLAMRFLPSYHSQISSALRKSV